MTMMNHHQQDNAMIKYLQLDNNGKHLQHNTMMKHLQNDMQHDNTMMKHQQHENTVSPAT